jgi:NAD(P)-dependent dehydrogenase (short-subunit alcohol dehydrogenase family)
MNKVANTPPSGLGALICDKFAKEGSNIIINYVSSATVAEEIAKTLEKEYGVKAFAVQGDMGVEADCVRVVEETVGRLGGLDVIVSNAVCLPSCPPPPLPLFPAK